MKLSNVLAIVNQVEKSKFINVIDRIGSEATSHDADLAKQVNAIDGQIKDASSSDITQLFTLMSSYFEKNIREQTAKIGAQAVLLINMLSRDGNCIARISWIESFYAKEWQLIDARANELKELIAEGEQEPDAFSYSRQVDIYFSCLKEAFENDTKINREAKITDDERGILNILAAKLGLTAEDQVALEHLVNATPKNGVQDALNALREIGLLFISRKRQTIYLPDEIVFLLNKIQGRDLADKYLLRMFRTMSDAELSTILKNHNRRIRGVGRREKISSILHMGLTARQILHDDLFQEGTSQNERKERLKLLINDLNIELDKLGTTLEERVSLIVHSLNSCTEEEFNALSATGFKDMFSDLQLHFPDLPVLLRTEFELEEQEEIDMDKLRALSITPHDILYMLSNDNVKKVIESMGLSKRGNLRLNILDSFASATDKLIDNYDLLAKRDLAGLKAQNIEIAEADIGIKFEETTKAIFEQLGLDVDEDLRRDINTAKDKADILVSLSQDDVIIGEAKTCKEGDFAKYSATSRQVKAYENRCKSAGKTVAQVLIVAPSFSKDFIESAGVDTEINISLLEAKGLKNILGAYKARRNPKFSAKLFTKGGLLRADLIAKNI